MTEQQAAAVVKLNPTEKLVLLQAIADHGEVVLTGIDAHPGWNKRHRTAAKRLHNLGFGKYWPQAGHAYATFQINDAGRERANQK